MGKAACVIGVQVGEDDPTHVTGRDAEATKLWTYLVIRTDGEAG
jgi:hypothetical protein